MKNKSKSLGKLFWVGLATLFLAPVLTGTLIMTSCKAKHHDVTSYFIIGDDKHIGVKGKADSAKYYAFDQNNAVVTDSVNWTISGSSLKGISIDHGVLSWSSDADPGQLELRCDLGNSVSDPFSVSLEIINPEPTPETFSIYGDQVVTGVAGIVGSVQYHAVNDIGVDITNVANWSLTNVPAGVSISNGGVLSWTDTASGGSFAINCAPVGLTGNPLQVTLSLIDPAPTPYIYINGDQHINNVAGIAGDLQYKAFANDGSDITTSANWNIPNAPTGVSIGAQNGLLSWNAQASTCQFAINCTKQGLESATCDVTLTLTDPTPSPTSIMINGDETLTGVVGIAGITHYEAIDNAGNDITNNSNWTLTSAPASVSINNSGILSWTTSANTCTFTVNCAKTGLTSASLTVTLTIITPVPAPNTFTIYGDESVIGVKGSAGSVRYHAIDNIGNDVTSNANWTLTSAPNGVTISDSSGLLSWTTTATAGTFTINCAPVGLTGNPLQVTLTLIDPAPAPYIYINGDQTLYGSKGTAGSFQYKAFANDGTDITTSANWSIPNAPTGVSIGAQNGLLSWSAQASTCQFAINCTEEGLKSATCAVSLSLPEPRPTPTAITINGDATVTGATGVAGVSHYLAIDDTGADITSSSNWSLTNAPATISINSSGTLSWNANAVSCTFTINCAKTGLTSASLAVTLTIITPTPTATTFTIIGDQSVVALHWETTDIKYYAYDNLGNDISHGANWSIENNPGNMYHINTYGVLHITGDCPSATIIIKCAPNGLTGNPLTVKITMLDVKYDLDIHGPLDLAVPYEKAWDFSSEDGIITAVDLPSCFSFNSLTGVLTYDGSMSGTYGTFKFLSTEKNGSGRTKEYTVSYYYVPTIAAGQCVYLKSDGTTETVTPSVSSGVINLTPGEISNPNQTIVGCYFGDMSNVTTIGDYFLGYCYVLRTVDLTSFSNVTNIGNQFLWFADKLTCIDLSSFSRVTNIGENFILSPPDLDLIDLSYFTNLETVGDGFLYNSGVTNVVVGNTDFSNVNFINPQHAFNDGYTNNFHSKIYSGAAAASFKHKIGNNMSEWTIVY